MSSIFLSHLTSVNCISEEIRVPIVEEDLQGEDMVICLLHLLTESSVPDQHFVKVRGWLQVRKVLMHARK